MHDHDLVGMLKRLVGKPLRCEFEDDRCVALDLTCEAFPYYGLVRERSDADKRQVMELVCRLSGLRQLNLRRNQITELPEAFAELQQLEDLTLGSNPLGCVPPAIEKFKKLRRLHLGNCDITVLPDFVAGLVNLDYLALHKNIRLRDVGESLRLPRLRNLNLYFISLRTLPKYLFELSDLVTLTLWNVECYPEELAQLQNLEFFTSVGCPGMHELPAALTKLRKLRMTRIYQNSLEKLPADIGDLQELEQISVYQNELSELPESFATLKKLRKINLGWNNFETLPRFLRDLPALEWVGVFENPLLAQDASLFGPNVRVDWDRPFSTVNN